MSHAYVGLSPSMLCLYKSLDTGVSLPIIHNLSNIETLTKEHHNQLPLILREKY